MLREKDVRSDSKVKEKENERIRMQQTVNNSFSQSAFSSAGISSSLILDLPNDRELITSEYFSFLFFGPVVD